MQIDWRTPKKGFSVGEEIIFGLNILRQLYGDKQIAAHEFYSNEYKRMIFHQGNWRSDDRLPVIISYHQIVFEEPKVIKAQIIKQVSSILLFK